MKFLPTKTEPILPGEDDGGGAIYDDVTVFVVLETILNFKNFFLNIKCGRTFTDRIETKNKNFKKWLIFQLFNPSYHLLVLVKEIKQLNCHK